MRQLYPDNTFVAPKLPNPNKDLVRLVIAEAPGADEALAGEPLVGGAGKWFDSMLHSAGIPRAGLTVANCIQCRPPDNVFPTDPEARSYISKEDAQTAVSHCRKAHVDPLLRSRKWKRIDLLGDKPLALIANQHGGIFKWRGSPMPVPSLGTDEIAIATLHPAYIMRDQVYFPVAVNDLLKSLTPPPEYYKPFSGLEDVANFRYDTFAFDIESERATGEIICVGLCAQPYFAMVVPFRGPYIAELKRIFRQAKTLIGHNILQFDLPMLRRHGVEASAGAVLYDTMLLQHLCFPDFPHDLGFVGSQFVSKPAWKADKDVLQIYCARDTDVTLQAFHQLLPLVKQNGLHDLYLDVQVPLAKICRLMHETGFKVDGKRILEVREKLIKERDEEEKYLPEHLRTHTRTINKRIDAPAGTLGKSGKPVKYTLVQAEEVVVPWRSVDCKKDYLYGSDKGLGLDPILDAKTGKITTGKQALAKIQNRFQKEGRPEWREVKALAKLNKLDELITTFAKADMVTVSRMFPHFNAHGTSTGRLSSSDPNLQNIPDPARYMYVPSVPGWVIIEVDYSGIENRLQSWFAGDTERTKRLTIPGFSEHKYLASKISGIPMEQIEKSSDPESVYSKAKHVVHGVDRGLGPLKASKMYDMPLVETKHLFEVWKREIKPTINWQISCAEKAKRQGYLRNPFGRMGWFWTSNYYTESLSFLPQSTAADVIYRAMIALMYERIGWPREKALKVARTVVPLPLPARLLIQVHDSLIFECPPEMVDEVVAVVKRVMEQPWAEIGGMSLPIGIKVGPSWGEVEDYKKLVRSAAA